MSKPLSGIRILDMTTALSGPSAAVILADLGAEIIKIETLDGDDTRHLGPRTPQDESAYYLTVNRSKKSVALDLKSEAGRAVFLDLAEKSDVVLDNFRGGVMKRLRLLHADIEKHNPKIITVSLSGFGADGPSASRPGFDLIIQALTGSMSVTGFPGQPPVRAGLPIGDLVGGLYATIAVCAAIAQKAITGKGSHASLSLVEANVSLLSYLATYWLKLGKVTGPQGSAHTVTAPYNVYRCGDGKWMALAAHQTKFFELMAKILGREELIGDPRFASHTTRSEHKAELDAMLSELFIQKPREHWIGMLVPSVPCAPVNSIDEVFNDPLVKSMAIVQEVRGDDGRVLPYVRSPITFGDEKPSASYPPRIGEHTHQVLADLLGYDEKRIRGLVDAGVASADGRSSKV